MYIGICGHKGGVGKTTTAVHIAACLQADAPTLLVDSDPNHSALEWARRGSLPFKVCGLNQAARLARDHKHIIFDSKARLDSDELRDLIESVDLLVLPTTPDALAIHGLMLTVTELQKVPGAKFKALLTIVPPLPNRDGLQARRDLTEMGVPLFGGELRRFIAYQKAALAGDIVTNVKDAHAADAWNDIQRIWRELQNEQI